MKYLLDTNALIYLQGDKLAHGLPVGSYAYSVISEIELLSWPQMQPEHEIVWRGLLASPHRVELDAARARDRHPLAPRATFEVARCRDSG